MNVRRITAAMAALLVLGTTVVACGDDDDDGSDGDSSSSTQDGGGSAEGEPIRIGLANLEGGAIAAPAYRYGADAAAEYVNDELGGVDGRPIELVTCDVDGSPEKSIDCANRFVEEGVVLVQPGRDPSVDAMLPILETAGIPIIGDSPVGQQVTTSPNAHFLSLPNQLLVASIFSFLVDQELDSLIFLGADAPAVRGVSESFLEPTAAQAGIEYRTQYYAGQPDFNVLAPTAMADDPDVIGVLGGGDETCVSFITALDAAGFDGRIWANCTGAIEVLGSRAAGMTFSSAAWLPDVPEAAPDAKQEEIDVYLDALDEAGHGDEARTIHAYTAFGQVVNLARILSTIEGPIDGATALAAVRSTVDFDTFMGPTVSCDGSATPGVNACSNSVLFWEVQDDGEIAPVSEDFVTVGAG